MRSFRKPAAIACFAATFGVGAFYLQHRVFGADSVKDSPAAPNGGGKIDPPPEAAQPAVPPPKATSGKKTKGGGSDNGKGEERMHDIPVAKDHPAKGLKIPYFDNEGKLQMVFVIGVATRIDADHINMADMQIETFDEAGQHEMGIDLPTSVLDLNTNVISTEKHVTIRREDFILTGETMEFNTKTKQGSLGGFVRMLVYNLDSSPAQANPNSKKKKGPTEITSGKATFDQKANIATFAVDVVVKDPEFNVVCDALTTYLKHDEKSGKGAKGTARIATPPPKAKPGDPDSGKKSGGLERAVAEMNPGGRVEITQDKKELDGTVTHSIGHGTKADYNAKTGDILLFGRPDVKKGEDMVIATDDSTAITLNRDGNMTTKGPSKTVIVSKDDKGKGEKAPTVITSGESLLDQKKHLAIFTTDVVVNDPEFNVICDKLTAYLKHEPEKTAGQSAKATPEAATPHPVEGKPGDTDPAKKSSGGLDRAVAEMNSGGRVEISQDKAEADGTISHAVGHGTKAEYDARTGDIKLFGSPEVKKAADLVVAMDDSTVITMNRDGHMSTKGPSKTVIVNKDDTGKKEKGPTEITSGDSLFDQKANVAIFTGNVVVKDPEFNVVCDKLTAYLKHGEAGGKGSTPSAKPVVLRPDDPAPAKKSSGGLEKAVAEMNPGGRVEISQDKKEADGTISHAVGHGSRADYNAINGDIKLFGKPEVKKGADWLVATEERTVITLNRNGHMYADGPSKTVIISKDETVAQ